MPTDKQMAEFCFSMLKQLDLKSIDWKKVASEQGISNGHAARMRYSRFRQQMGGSNTAGRAPRGGQLRNSQEPTKDTAAGAEANEANANAPAKNRKRDKRGSQLNMHDARATDDDEEVLSKKRIKREAEAASDGLISRSAVRNDMLAQHEPTTKQTQHHDLTTQDQDLTTKQARAQAPTTHQDSPFLQQQQTTPQSANVSQSPVKQSSQQQQATTLSNNILSPQTYQFLQQQQPQPHPSTSGVTNSPTNCPVKAEPTDEQPDGLQRPKSPEVKIEPETDDAGREMSHVWREIKQECPETPRPHHQPPPYGYGPPHLQTQPYGGGPVRWPYEWGRPQ